MHLARLIALISILFLVGCSAIRQSITSTTPVVKPSPPAELLDLPRRMQIRCSSNPDLNQGSGVYVWELPGLTPADSDSDYYGDRGKELGTIPSCDVVTAIKYVWSQPDEEFYIYIKSKDLEGWITLDLLEPVP
jgi:hypothetical protein